ncbi:BIR protein [Plasmodium berghei]|uniref:BIR protein n=2 Tax=Plasmodium berghei TaxID=5821 RepID=A0A509ATW1_PLABA|nr:BIR protein [Plasmodium berghei ANKA]CXJ09289.1 BIR protein [Plasmodium berghei]SCL83765.1 BIR protein [Plasmodium berghei]SCL85721.1 BIR protein [Plasmodium berghei]SCM25890.1 BIR protein [Plasmodium berghei]SCN28166.1 BIR protein [Plasmodium berghei]|eukprot:XP_034423824.1 BIR protein [Plasmodium berghei ANKA]
MNDYVCRRFLLVRNWFPDQLVNGEYTFNNDDENFKKYCTSNQCSSNLEKINAGCLFLFDAFFKDSSSFKYHNNIDIVEYIMIWLSYMLSLKEQSGSTTNLEYFNKTYINSNEKYTNSITDVTEYSSYKDLIDKKHDLTKVDIKYISKFYAPFKLLCEMYTNFDEKTLHCSICSENANKFVNKYKEMSKNSVITSNSSYKQLLSTLSNEYNNFKNYCNSKGGNCKNYPPLETIEIKTSAQNSDQISEQLSTQGSEQIPEQLSTHGSEVTSSNSSITNKLLLVLLIFGAIAFFLGISYKYSLFGFRKRAQKQYLREKIKNIKKGMNH